MSAITTSEYYQNITVDEAPGANGYFSNTMGALTPDRSNKVGVRAKDPSAYKVYFAVRSTGLGIVTLQFLCPGDTEWSDYAGYNAAVCKTIVVGDTGIQWRAGVKYGDYVSGDVTFGFNW